MFFVLSVPFLLLWAYRLKMNLFAAFRLRMSSLSYWFTLAYLQLMPWFVMATGSRTARVAFVGTFLALLTVRRTRGLMLAMLPSTAVAYFVAFYYQSLPSAVDRFLSANADPNMSLSDRFFAMPERAQLANETLGVMTSASNWLKLVGFGPGTGGYRLSGFPEPHNFFMNQWAETGAVGIFALVAFFVALIWGLIRHALPQREQSFQSVLLLVALMSFAGVSLTYNPSYWGGAMELVLILSTAVVAFDQRTRVPNNLDRGSAEVTWGGARTILIGEPKRSTV
ncbi:MAG: O-antigen ligase family protein [Rhodopseudomonas sp.]|uniref:O-antigen ligase family protein n=1 Tax=Rhodopseudomonas sp. TaxID=1078 RepID=UPI0039E3381B